MRGGLRTAVASACAGAALLAAAPAAPAAVQAGFDARLLRISGGNGAERVTVVCDGDGRVQVNGRNPKGGPVACDKVAEINAEMGGGNDVIDFSGVTGAFGEARFPGFGVGTGALAIGGEGDDRFFGGPGAFNAFYGEGGDDRAAGGPARDVLAGGGGNDKLIGSAGDDVIGGGAGRDRLRGGPGRDRLVGGPGKDDLRGGAGEDAEIEKNAG
jgi:Ca2+-binding RTX toxin-like protein